MMTLRKRRRSASTAAQSGQRVMVGTRLTRETKALLDAAVEQSGRSQAQEIELRLERSFERQDLLSEVLSLVYGPAFAELLIALATVMDRVGQMTHRHTHQDRKLAHAVEIWTHNWAAYQEAVLAAVRVLYAARPKALPATFEGPNPKQTEILQGLLTAAASSPIPEAELDPFIHAVLRKSPHVAEKASQQDAGRRLTKYSKEVVRFRPSLTER